MADSGLPFPETRFVSVPDGRLVAFCEFGDRNGTPVIYAHGSPGSRLEGALFDDLAGDLGFRVICADRPGFGRSTFLADRELLQYPKDIVHLADHLSLDRFGVLGWSGGGAHTTACAYEIPDRLLFNITCAGYTNFAEWPEAPLRLESSADRMAMKLSDRAPWLFNAMFSASGFYARHWPQSYIKYLKKMTNESGYQLFDDERFVDVFGKTQQESYAQGGKGVAEDARVHYRDWGFRLEQIAMPIHIFHGTLDQLVPFAFSEHLVNNAPEASLHRIDDLGHLFPAMPEYQRQIFTTAKSAMT